MANRSVALVRIGGQENIAFFDCSFIRVQKAVDKRPELSDDHAALAVGDQRKLVVLLADTGRHRGAEQHGVHLVARVAQRAFDNVERDWIDVDLAKRRLARDDLRLTHFREYLQSAWLARNPPDPDIAQ